MTSKRLQQKSNGSKNLDMLDMFNYVFLQTPVNQNETCKRWDCEQKVQKNSRSEI